MLTDTAHQQQDERVAIASAQFVADAFECVGVQALVGIAELCPEQTDAPRYLQPQHKQWDGSKRTIDGVVGTQLYLIVYVQPFDNHKHGARQDAGQNRVFPLDACVGHQREKQHEDNNCKGYWRDVQDEGHRVREQPRVGQQRSERLQEDAQTTCDDDDERQQQEDPEVIDDLPVDGARALDEPYRVEGLLDVCRKREQRVEQEYQANADEDATLGMLQVGIDEIENRVGNIGIAFQRVPKLCLDDGVEAEATGNGEYDGKHRHGCQHAAVGQRRSIVHDVVLRDALPGDDESLQNSQTKPLKEIQPLLVDAPYMFYTYHVIQKEKASEPVSRVLCPCERMLVIYLRTVSPLPSIVLPSSSSGPPSLLVAGLHELSTPGVHSIDITADLVSSCLTFSPLPLEGGGYFLLHLLTLADHFPLGSGMPCVARTFLSLLWQRQAGSLSVSGCKDTTLY